MARSPGEAVHCGLHEVRQLLFRGEGDEWRGRAPSLWGVRAAAAAAAGGGGGGGVDVLFQPFHKAVCTTPAPSHP